MGNAGVTIYNETQYPINIFLSMIAPHHYCNGLKPNEAFTIYPGAVWYTINAYLDTEDNRMSDGQVAAQVSLVAVPAALGTATAVFTGGITMAAGLGSTSAASISGTALSTYSWLGASTGAFAFGQLVSGIALNALESALFAIILEGIACGTVAGVVPALVLQGALGKGLEITGQYQKTTCIAQAKDCCELLEKNQDKIHKLLIEFENIAKQCKLDPDIKRIYCGRTHKTLKVVGGPYIKNGMWVKRDFTIQKCQPSEIPKSIQFRKKDGLYNNPFEYWQKSDCELYPPNNL